MLNEDNFSDMLNQKLFQLKLKKLEQVKFAYPNDVENVVVPGEHNLGKWVQTLKDIYYKCHQEKMPWKQAFDSSVEGWNPVERLDFDSWVRYYEGKNHQKYNIGKVASWYDTSELDEEGNTVNFGGIPNALRDINNAKDSGVSDISSAEKNKQLQKHKKKIISRLDSVEKLLRSEEGFLLSEEENDALIESIHALKKKVYSLKKKTSSDLFYKDLIVREANVLAHKGLFKAASFLYVAADEKISEAAAPPPAPPAAPVTNSPGVIGTAPAPAAPDTSPAPTAGQTVGKPPTEDSTPDFVKQIDIAEDGDLLAADDDLVVEDENLLSFAQEATPEPAPAPAPAPAPVVPAIEVKDFDQKLESTLSQVTIEDVVKKMNEISKIFKTREIPRQLSIIDMMLDQLGIASFFPSLSEATNKALESNNYILTRLEDIVMQLTGAVKTKSLDLAGEGETTPEHAQAVKQNLEEQARIEKERKEMRKELADKALEERTKEEAPELEVTEEDLQPAAPPAAPAPAAAPAAPAPPPAA